MAKRLRLTVLASLAAFTSSLSGAQTPASPAPIAQPAPPRIESAADALNTDAAEYARQFGVPLEEAVRRLRAQDDSAPAVDRLQERYRSRLAGVFIQHVPDYRIIFFLTGGDAVSEQYIRAGGMEVPISFRTGAKATRDRVIWAMTNHQSEIRASLSSPPGMGLDPRTGELVVIVGRAEAASRGPAAIKAAIEAMTGVPVQIRVLDRKDVNLDPMGGSRVEGVSPADGRRYVCSTGFSVTDGTRYGVTTAAHCLDTLSYIDPAHQAAPMAFVGQWGWGYQDVQINVGDRPLGPLFYSDAARTTARPVIAARTRASTRAGDFVCHRGERTGYSCAQVELTDFAPAGDLCGGACLPTWVTVAGPNCKGGDSGSPVFSGTTAFGIVKGGSYRPDGSCAFYFYMSVDYLPVGWSLVHG